MPTAEGRPFLSQSTIIQLTPAAVQRVDQTFERLRADARAVLETYRDEELETLARFLADVRALVREHTQRLSRA